MARRKKRDFYEQIRVDQQNLYDEFNTTQIKFKFNNRTDSDILDWLYRKKTGKNTSMQGEIKRLIRQEILKEKQNI